MAAILPICHPVDGIRRLLFHRAWLVRPCHLIRHKDLLPAEANHHVIPQNLAAAIVFLAIASAAFLGCGRAIPHMTHRRVLPSVLPEVQASHSLADLVDILGWLCVFCVIPQLVF